MIKALLRKEMAQIRKMYLTNKRKGKQGGKGMLIFLIIIYFVLMLSMGALDSLFAFNLIPTGNGWLYYFFITAMAFIIGVIGSAFTTAEMLFRAKDNELLMSMPIPPANILLVRMIGVYFMGMIYELLVMLPGIILYYVFAGITLLNLLFGILGIILLGFIILAFSCFFGWIIAVITAKLKNKTALTVVISVIFIGFFIYFRFVADSFFRDLIENSDAIGRSIRSLGYPFYAPGLGMTGNVPGMLVFAAIAGVLFGVTYLLVSKSFNRIVDIQPSEKKAVFKDSMISTASTDRALVRKEFKRFLSSPAYMLNCGMGLLFLVAGAIAMLFAAGPINSVSDSILGSIPGGARLLPVIGTFAVCILGGMVDIAAPSISLEGSYIGILQSMPISPMQVIRAKFIPAALIAGIPSVICTVIVLAVLKASVPEIILGVLCTGSFIMFTTLFGLRFDLARPVLDWTTEIQPIKQSLSVLFSMLIGILGPVIPAGLYIMLAPAVPAIIYLAVWAVLFAAASLLIINWFKKKGAQKFVLLGQ